MASRNCSSWLVPALLLTIATPSQGQKARSFDHVHFSVPDPAAAHAWYARHLGGVPGESPDRLTFGDMPYSGRPPLPVQLLWAQARTDASSARASALAGIAFSVPNVRAKVAELLDAGARLRTPLQAEQQGWTSAVVVDPWNVPIELLDDPERRGFHHVRMDAADPAASSAWYQKNFGGTATTVRGSSALHYGNVFVIFVQAAGAPSPPGVGLNHIGFAATDIDGLAARLRAAGVSFSVEPRTTLNSYGHRVAFLDGPDGVRIELVEHTQCMFTPREGEVAAF